VIQSAVRIPRTGKVERRVLSVNEIVGYDPIEGRFNYIELFSWKPAEDEHEFRGRGSSHLLENKIAVMRGIDRRNLGAIYDDLMMRARLLRKLVDLGVYDYLKVWKLVKQAYNIGVKKLLALIEEGERPWESD